MISQMENGGSLTGVLQTGYVGHMGKYLGNQLLGYSLKGTRIFHVKLVLLKLRS